MAREDWNDESWPAMGMRRIVSSETALVESMFIPITKAFTKLRSGDSETDSESPKYFFVHILDTEDRYAYIESLGHGFLRKSQRV